MYVVVYVHIIWAAYLHTWLLFAYLYTYMRYVYCLYIDVRFVCMRCGLLCMSYVWLHYRAAASFCVCLLYACITGLWACCLYLPHVGIFGLGAYWYVSAPLVGLSYVWLLYRAVLTNVEAYSLECCDGMHEVINATVYHLCVRVQM